MLLASLAVVAGYLRDQVLNTDRYVQTVAPLGNDPTVRGAVASRLTEEIIVRSDLAGLLTELTTRLAQQGAPSQLTGLVGPTVSGISRFLNDKINDLMATPRFAAAWVDLNRAAHQGLVTVLTGRQGELIASQGDTVTIDIGKLLALVKQHLVAEGMTFLERIPDVSIPYPLLQSAKLPTLQTYARLLDAAATWLPWVALGLLLLGVLAAPDRRRGILLGTLGVGLVALAFLAGLAGVRTYYVDHLPAQVHSPDAAAVVLDTLLRFLDTALWTLVAMAAVFVVGSMLAGPGRAATGFRKLLNPGLDALARTIRRTGGWATRTGQLLAAAYHPIHIGLVLLALVLFGLAERPGLATLLWTTMAVLAVLVVMEVFVRAFRSQ